jgi:hypothetical protein
MTRLTITAILSAYSLTLLAQDYMGMNGFMVDSDTSRHFNCLAFYNPDLEPPQELDRDLDDDYWYQKDVPCVVHVLYSDSIPNSYIDYDIIVDAIQHLDEEYEGTDINFELVGVDYTEVLNYGWGQGFVDYDGGPMYYPTVCFYNAMSQMDEYANDVNWDTHEYLNIYVVPKMCRTLLGYSWVHFNPYSDVYGVWVHARGFGRWGEHLDFPFIQNKTLVHEAGHWCGLHHVFVGVDYCGESDGVPCQFDGDFCCDTPPTKVNFTCVNPTCPPALYDYEPNNHMDYYVDSCRTEFTSDQINRMHMMMDYMHADMFDAGEPYCVGDVSGDGIVGILDILAILDCLSAGGDIDSEECMLADINNGGQVDIGDLQYVLAFFGWNCNEQTMGMGLSEGQQQRILNWASNVVSRRGVSVEQLMQEVRREIYTTEKPPR